MASLTYASLFASTSQGTRPKHTPSIQICREQPPKKTRETKENKTQCGRKANKTKPLCRWTRSPRRTTPGAEVTVCQPSCAPILDIFQGEPATKLYTHYSMYTSMKLRLLNINGYVSGNTNSGKQEHTVAETMKILRKKSKNTATMYTRYPKHVRRFSLGRNDRKIEMTTYSLYAFLNRIPTFEITYCHDPTDHNSRDFSLLQTALSVLVLFSKSLSTLRFRKQLDDRQFDSP